MLATSSGNVKRRQIVDVLEKNSSETFDKLEKLSRIPKIMLGKTLTDMTGKGIVKEQNSKYGLTENGVAAVTLLHAM